LLCSFFRVIPGAHHLAPRGWFYQDATVFHVAQRVALGGIGRVGVLQFPVIVFPQMDEAAIVAGGENSANLLDRVESRERACVQPTRVSCFS
jgi:hypothetical protein